MSIRNGGLILYSLHRKTLQKGEKPIITPQQVRRFEQEEYQKNSLQSFRKLKKRLRF